MTEATPLPSLDECTSALSACLGDAAGTESSPSSPHLETWRKLIQRCLSHGTSYDRLHESKSRHEGSKKKKKTKNQEEEDDESRRREEEDARSRAEDAGNLLGEALEWYSTRRRGDGPTTKNAPSDDDGEPQSPEEVRGSLKDDPVVCAVVEALWLVGCLLESSPDDESAAAGASGGDGAEGDDSAGTDPTKLPHECLLAIIRKLTAPRPGAEGGGREEDGAEKGEDVMEVDATNDNGDANEAEAGDAPVSITSIQAALELTLLEAAGMLPNPPPASVKKAPRKGGTPVVETPVTAAEKKLKKMNTDMYYRQHKFNLLAEESEGYAKLWSFLVAGPRAGEG
eukprot:CAMPEP_0172529622 /NCGR_PEP_ID=MMETSP1067-20121228/3661_1 /TAXON_ID=265564 ORGANISM="Thalassiosira punctigera, Strain Tpunct2005C2" /NCGR_SAMPLE_ID=MMETSP1067 /ASSEMBLY_ACC=CAM_ASM_000444 /LENGTH=340 /DNA_ID=CAMNT_0013313715 /DNA_START=28 /DNA_END=1047 /DNA_ORIENTATION=-